MRDDESDERRAMSDELNSQHSVLSPQSLDPHPSSFIPHPSSPWVMGQVWQDLLFAHWPLDPARLRPLIPAGLDLDTFEGQAWVAVVPFHMSNIRLRRLPGVPTTTRFAELNVRTYVNYKGQKPGVFFFCLDAASPLAVAVARRWYHLPYFNARMVVDINQDTVNYSSQRTHRGATPAQFTATYGPTGEVYRSRPGTLEHWLTERYCLYTTDRRGRVYRGDIRHEPWPLQPAQADLRFNTMAQAHNISLPDLPPLLHFARRLEVVAWSIRRVD